ncbi:MAG: MmgE/PrpD family protein [Armatimonadetes bacterium]|nr:MmgE/PrpD family protein [Armatimonadota bacterium]
MSTSVTLARNSNQALGLGQYAIDFLREGNPDRTVLRRTAMFHLDAVICGLSALALHTNAPVVLRQEALEYPDPAGATAFGSNIRVKAEKAVVANSSAVREWDSNGTNFGYRPELGHTAGEFGHNDFYPVVVAACQQKGLDGLTALKAMVCLDEIRGRLAEVFSLKTYKLDHVVHGAIASAAVYGALMGATAEQIESAIGMFVAHTVPWRAIRAGKQLSDSKGASAAISTESAILFMKRAMNGFVGPKDIFRNPEAIFRFFEPTTEGAARWKEQGDSPFDLVLSMSGSDFAVMRMHFKLGLYEHQSAGALQGVINLLADHPDLLRDQSGSGIGRITILAYEPAFGIIGNPMKKSPTTRQSADHSMAYIVATLIRKAVDYVAAHGSLPSGGTDHDAIWKALILTPWDYKTDESALYHPVTRAIMDRIDFQHGGPEYDAKYPEGIPTSIKVGNLNSGLIMFPAGHAGNTTADLESILENKFQALGSLALENPAPLIEKLANFDQVSADQMIGLWDLPLLSHADYES